MSAHCKNNGELDWLDVLAEQLVGDVTDEDYLSDSVVDSVFRFANKIRYAPAGDVYEYCMQEANRRHRRETAIKRLVKRHANSQD